MYDQGARLTAITNATRSVCPPAWSVMCGWLNEPRATSLSNSRAKTTSGERRRLAVRSRPSTRRTTSASRPTPALNAKRRPLMRPTRTCRSVPSRRATASRRAAAGIEGGSPRLRAITLVPPPGRSPIGTSAPIPLSTSLAVPSPPSTMMASKPSSTPVRASAAASRGRVVRTTSTVTDSSSSR